MENKKNKKADLEQNRTSFFLVGLNYIIALVLASFTFKIPNENKELGNLKEKSGNNSKDIPIVVPPKNETKETPTVNFTPPPTENIIEKQNTNEEPVSGVPIPPVVEIAEETKIDPPPIEEPIEEFPEIEAEFIGGAQAMMKHIQQNVQYPASSMDMNEQGKVFVSFVVEPDGSISNVSVERGVSTDLDREAKRLVRDMPKWKPGESRGRKVRARCRLPINFQLS